ncbi:Regulation of nuclear pre-mRNA domain containing protein 1B [Phytophthora pseudosyringae]|uniref:Regulation of nuclear pre-mRNA domain containing protein 1B n=1 Tax=Phytophthora pseudosyringae TaxID=221518 RepID=A0A8T1VW71_9STRA|nr:Regulation of nuclear pre-mRNA domain containing protein 1B [Phytophthora pseudosyringae]
MLFAGFPQENRYRTASGGAQKQTTKGKSKSRELLAAGVMYSREKLEGLLRQTKVTTQSIQKVSQWMLSHRQHLPEMVLLWSDLLREGEAEHQIVYLYVANDAMQVGVRKFGRHIAAAFEEKLVETVQLVMRDAEEKVKRCAIKIVGIWKERGVVTPPLLAMLENVCAGKPAVEEVLQPDGKEEEKKTKLLQEMTSDAAVEHVLEDMPEVAEAATTTRLAAHLQDLVNATISADMLSDRMFQLESSISVFHHACGEQDEEENDDVVVVGEENDRTFPSAGGIAWSKMDQQVYDLDLDNSRGHVEQYRTNLTEQAAKREALINELRGLETTDLFSFPSDSTAKDEAEQQERALERLYHVACEAEKQELKQLEEQRAEFRARQASIAASASDPLYSGYQPVEEPYRPVTPTASSRGRSDSGNSHLGYRRPSYEYDQPQQRSSPTLRRHSSASAVTDRDIIDDRYNDANRYGGSNDRYGTNSPSTSKRPKLHHSHSMESQNVQWQEASRYSPPRGGIPPNPYAAVEREQTAYSPRDNRYSPRDQYQAPPPRQGRRSRWDSMPEDRYNNHYDDRRW